MPRKITLPEGFKRPTGLLATNATKLPLLQTAIEKLAPTKQTPPLIAAEFGRLADLPTATALDMITQIMAFQGMRTGLSLTAAETFEVITASLEEEAQDSKVNYLEKWRASRPLIEAVLDPAHPLVPVFKSLTLLYDYQNVVHSATIITDLRPVFDDAACEVRRMLISHVIEIEYSDGRQRQKLFAALDAGDIAKLKKACERAESKAATLQKALQMLPWPVVESGSYSED